MKRALRFGSLVSAAACAVACGGQGGAGTPTDSPTAVAVDPVNNPHGYPACGNDPSTQPSPCIDDKFAVRCKANSGYPGDELALCDLPPSEGYVIHMGPSDYSNPDDVKPWLLGPGGEEEICQHANTTNTELQYFDSYHGRMRPGSHHWILTLPNTHTDTEAAPYVCPPQIQDRWLFGAQSPTIDVMKISGGGDPPKPGDIDYGLAHDFPPQQTVMMDLHYVNATDQTVLREAWGSMNMVPASKVLQKVDLISWINLGIDIPPMGNVTTKRLHCAAPSATEPVYLGLATAHAHSRMQRLSLYHGAAGTEEVVYESRNWHEPGEAFFRDGVPNPALPVADGQNYGAVTGYVKILPGEELSFECQYANTENRHIGFGDTSKDEMCNVFGFYYPSTGTTWNCFGAGQ